MENHSASLPPVDYRQIPALLQALAKHGSKQDRAEFEKLAQQTGPLLAYLERQGEIQAATATLEAHRQEFEQLYANPEAYRRLTVSLFAEDRFKPLHFTPADIQRAFEQAGYPTPGLELDDKNVKVMMAALLLLANQDWRKRAAMALLIMLPDYVNAGRYLDAWALQACSLATAEHMESSNPFLFQMFAHGYDTWQAEQQAHRGALIQELGLDPERLAKMSLPEIHAWLKEQQANPAQQARMTAIMQANPGQHALATAGLIQMRQDSVHLLETAIH